MRAERAPRPGRRHSREPGPRGEQNGETGNRKKIYENEFI